MTPVARVLQVIPVVGIRMGGPAVNVVELSGALRDAGIESVVYATDVGSAPNALERVPLSAANLPAGADEIELHTFKARPPHRLMYAPSMGGNLRRGVAGFDVVHIHSLFLYPQFAAFRHALAKGVPYVVAPCGALDPNLRYRSPRAKKLTDVLWQRRMLNRAAALHYKTDEERDLTADLAYAAPPVVVPNGIRWEAFQSGADGRRFRERFLGGHEGPVVMNLGRLSHKKGLDVLIRAFALVRRGRPDVRLAIVGPDDEGLVPTLRGVATEAGVGDAVAFPGLLSAGERAGALAAADVWALPSSTENFGNAVLEALAAGVPAVLSPEINIAPAAAAAGAAIVAAREPEAFAGAIERLLDDPAERETLAGRARAFARGYDWAAIAPRMLAVYEEAAARS